MESMEQNDHFIPDGMNDFERSVKRVGDCLLAFIGLIIFSPYQFSGTDFLLAGSNRSKRKEI